MTVFHGRCRVYKADQHTPVSHQSAASWNWLLVVTKLEKELESLVFLSVHCKLQKEQVSKLHVRGAIV